MKSAYSMFSFDENADLDWALGHIAEAGYQGVELVMGQSGYLTPSTGDADLGRIRAAASSAGLEIHSVGVWSIWENNLLSDDPAVRSKAYSILSCQLNAASVLGASRTLMVPGYVGCDFIEGSRRVGYTDAWNRAIDAFGRLGELASDLKVRIGIETVWNKFLLSPLEMKNFIDEIDNPSVGVYLDTGNVIYTGYPEDWLDVLGGRIAGIHLSDYRRSQAGLGAFVDLFAGDVDFEAVAAALARAGWDDYLTLEMLPNYRRFPELSCYSNKPAVDRIIDMVNSQRGR